MLVKYCSPDWCVLKNINGEWFITCLIAPIDLQDDRLIGFPQPFMNVVFSCHIYTTQEKKENLFGPKKVWVGFLSCVMSIPFQILSKYQAKSISMIAKEHCNNTNPSPHDYTRRYLTKNLLGDFVEDIDHKLSVLIVDRLWLQCCIHFLQ